MADRKMIQCQVNFLKINKYVVFKDMTHILDKFQICHLKIKEMKCMQNNNGFSF